MKAKNTNPIRLLEQCKEEFVNSASRAILSIQASEMVSQFNMIDKLVGLPDEQAERREEWVEFLEEMG